MDYKYFPHTEDDLQAMMEKVGVKTLDDLYVQIPDAIRFKDDYQLPSEMSEMEVRELFGKLGSQNKQLTCFAGYGVYDHYTPSVVPSLLQRSEFLTSYTPYQAEIRNRIRCWCLLVSTPRRVRCWIPMPCIRASNW